MHFGWRALLPLFVLSLLILGFFAAYQAKVFNVKRIVCQTDQGDCPDYVQAELNSHRGQSLFFTDFSQFGDEITRLAPFLARYELSKQFPDTVIFTFFSAEPKYRYVEADGRTWLIDNVGYVIGLANPEQTNYPTVHAGNSVSFQPNVRERVEQNLHQEYLDVFEAIQLQNLSDSQFFLLNENDAYLKLADGKKAYFSLDQAPEQLAKLSYLLKHLSFSTFKEPIAEIDLRFSQVILRNHLSSASAAAAVKP